MELSVLLSLLSLAAVASGIGSVTFRPGWARAPIQGGETQAERGSSGPRYF
jgi:hypothetical protein